MIKKKYIFGMILLFVILISVSFVSSTYARAVTSEAQYARAAGVSGFGSTNSLKFDKSMCEQGGKDLLVQIVPFGCTPAVVRSDLLEEEDVQILCQLGATKINPLIDIEAIDYMTITGDYSKQVKRVEYFPSQAALGIGSGELTSPILNNLGYVVIILNRQSNESAMPSYVQGNLTAKIRYDIKSAFGVGNVNFYLPVLSDEEWNQKFTQYSFWEGRGYLRALDVNDEGAQIALYADDSVVTSGVFSREGRTYSKTKYSSFYLDKGETSSELYLPGFSPCLATLNVKLDNLINPETRVKLKVGSDYVEVAKKEQFLDNKCSVREIKKQGLYQSVKVSCKDDEKGSETVILGISPRIKLKIDGVTEEYGVGDLLFTTANGEKSVYLGYVGSYDNSEKSEDLYALLVALPGSKEKLSASDLDSLNSYTDTLVSSDTGAGVWDAIANGVKALGSSTSRAVKWLMGKDLYFISYKNPKTGVVSIAENVDEKEISLAGYGEGEDMGVLTLTEDVYTLEKDSTLANILTGKGYVIKQDGEKTGLRLREYTVGGATKMELQEDSLSANYETYGEFSSEIVCGSYVGCPKFTLSTGSDFKGSSKDFNGFFENLLGAEINPATNELSVSRAVFDDSSDAKFNVYYENAMKDFQTVDVSFSGEKESESSEETYGERALYESISLAYYLNKKKTMLELCEEFKDKYDKSILYANVLAICDNEYRVSSDELSSTEFSINGIITKISFEGIYEPSPEEYGVELFVQGPTGKSRTLNLGNNKVINLIDFRNTPIDKDEYVKLMSLDEDFADIYIAVAGETTIDKLFSSDTRRLELDNPTKYGDYTFTLKKINLEKSAKVSIKGNANFQYTQADFGFKVGIEKRSFPLTPEKATRKIKALNSSIGDWQKASDALAGVVKVMKTACTVTGGWLTFKNLVANLGGKSIARQKVMQGVGGWTNKCTDMVSDKDYVSLDKCFLENSNQIDKEVNEMYSVLQANNEQIKALEAAAKNANGYVDTNKLAEGLSSQTIPDLKTTTVQGAVNSVDSANPIDFSNIDTVLSADSFKASKYSLEQLKEISLYADILQSTTTSTDLKTTAKERLYNVLDAVEVNAQTYALQKSFEQTSGLKSSSILDLGKEKSMEIPIYVLEPFSSSSYKGYTFVTDTKISSEEYVYAIKPRTGGDDYLIVYDVSDREGIVKNTYRIIPSLSTLSLYREKDKEGNLIVIQNPFNIYFKKYDENSLKNPYKNPVLRYYEEEPFKGNPAVVPFNKAEGWYAATKPVLSTGGNIQAYDASGVVKSFWLCNVGQDGLEDFFSSARDDICGMMNLGTGQPYNQFSGLSESKAAELVTSAVNAIKTAQDAYANGIKKVRIGGVIYDVGSPAVSTPSIQCQDFMSPKECNLLFNVCDPVVCPSSRCDLGGTFPVQNVIQSGIIGSIALCLPNVKEGIVVPICISGVQAGMDGFISVQESYRDCLQTNINTGQTVGICDEVYSIYMCDFFWKQALPLIKLTVPKILSAILGQNSRGGGEYLGVQDALAKAKESIDYFKSYYAANSWKAFKLRSTEEVGAEVCKSFPSIVYPGSGNFLDSLTEPDSPFQFTGNFQETVMTTATNPPISHYKVFYHIYAGKDVGAYYFVYLRQGTGSSYYQDTVLDRRVASGYIPLGGYATNTTDFTAPSGYKQLCISVNGQEDCDFEQTSTSFAVNYLSDLYIKEQTTELVKTEAECISGTASLYSLLNPNVQSAVEEILNPAIYEDGIIRVCATKSPGMGTDASYEDPKEARWVSVGYCGDINVKCWLDRNKVQEIVKSLKIEGEILDETSANYEDTLFKQGNYLTTAQFKEEIKKIQAESSLLKKIEMINVLFDKIFFNNQKAKLFLMRGQAYSSLALGEYMDIIFAKKAAEAAAAAAAAATENETTPGTTPTEKELALAEFNAKYISPEILFNDKNLLTSGDICYRYYNSKWQWAVGCGNRAVWNDVNTFDEDVKSDKVNNEEDRVKEIIYALQKQDRNYLGGLKVLVDKITADNNAELSDETFKTTTMDEKRLFTVKFSDADYESMRILYFKHNDTGWFWEINKKFVGGGIWQSLSNVAPGFNNEQKNVVSALKGKTLYEGAAILFDPTSEDIIDFFGIETNIPSNGQVCTPPTISPTISQISNARLKVLQAAVELEGDSSSKAFYSNCWESAYYVYTSAGVENKCFYSDIVGKQYSIQGTTINIGVDKNANGETIYQIASTPKTSCALNKQSSSAITENQKLDNLHPGYLLSIVYNKDNGHNVIFIEWVDPANRIAKLFDWNGVDEDGNRVFRYYEEDLSDNQHPVYMYWEPVIA